MITKCVFQFGNYTKGGYKRPITGCYKTFWSKWLFEHSTTHQLVVSMDTTAARSPKRFIQPNRSIKHSPKFALVTKFL